LAGDGVDGLWLTEWVCGDCAGCGALDVIHRTLVAARPTFASFSLDWFRSFLSLSLSLFLSLSLCLSLSVSLSLSFSLNGGEIRKVRKNES
jgi:hypothetical protein